MVENDHAVLLEAKVTMAAIIVLSLVNKSDGDLVVLEELEVQVMDENGLPNGPALAGGDAGAFS